MRTVKEISDLTGIKHDKKNSGANAIRNLQHKKVLCCVLNAAQSFFHFWWFWAVHLMPCTQGAPLHFTESGNNQPNRKRSHKAAHRLHDTVKRGMVQSIRANSRYFTNPATLEFFFPNSSLFRPKIHAKPS